MSNIIQRLLVLVLLLSSSLAVRSQDAFPVRKGFQLATLNRGSEALYADISFLQSKGADLFRFPIYIYHDSLANWLDKVEYLLQRSAKNRRFPILVVTIHRGPLPHPPVESHPDFPTWWAQIAPRLRAYPNVWYDLANEPENTPDWHAVALRTANLIREIDTQNYIVFSPGGVTTTAIRNVKPLPGIRRQIMTVHFYNWGQLQHSANAVYPSGFYSEALLNQNLRELARYSRDNRIPVYVGEVAFHRESRYAGRFFNDFLRASDHFGLSVSVHAYKEADLWDYQKNPSAWAELTQWLGR